MISTLLGRWSKSANRDSRRMRSFCLQTWRLSELSSVAKREMHQPHSVKTAVAHAAPACRHGS